MPNDVRDRDLAPLKVGDRVLIPCTVLLAEGDGANDDTVFLRLEDGTTSQMYAHNVVRINLMTTSHAE